MLKCKSLGLTSDLLIRLSDGGPRNLYLNKVSRLFLNSLLFVKTSLNQVVRKPSKVLQENLERVGRESLVS